MATLADINAKKYLPAEAVAIRAGNARQTKAVGAELYQRDQQRQAETADMQHLFTQLQAMEGAHNADPKAVAAIKAEIQEFKDRFKIEDADADARRLDLMNTPAPPATDLIDMALEHDIKSKQNVFGYSEDLSPEQSPRPIVDECRDTNKSLKAERDSIVNAPKPADEALDVIRAKVTRAADNAAAMSVRNAARVHFNPGRNRFDDAPYKLPELALYDGVGQQLRVPDAMGLLCLLFPDEVVNRLADLATGGKSDADAGALSMHERVAKLADVDARILANDRRGEWAIRQCQARGIASGPRWTKDYRAVLDLE